IGRRPAPLAQDRRFLRAREADEIVNGQEITDIVPAPDQPQFVPPQLADPGDRKSVVWGKSVSVRVDLGGRRISKTKTTHRSRHHSIHTSTVTHIPITKE